MSERGEWGWGVAARNKLQLDNLGDSLRRWESSIYWMLSESRTNSMTGFVKNLIHRGETRMKL